MSEAREDCDGRAGGATMLPAIEPQCCRLRRGQTNFAFQAMMIIVIYCSFSENKPS